MLMDVVENSPIIFRILIYFATLFLPSNTPIYSTKGKTMTRNGSEGLIRFFFTRSESLEHFSRAKSSFWTAKIHEIIWETHFHSSEFLIKLSLELKSVIKYSMLYTQ